MAIKQYIGALLLSQIGIFIDRFVVWLYDDLGTLCDAGGKAVAKAKREQTQKGWQMLGLIHSDIIIKFFYSTMT